MENNIRFVIWVAWFIVLSYWLMNLLAAIAIMFKIEGYDRNGELSQWQLLFLYTRVLSLPFLIWFVYQCL